MTYLLAEHDESAHEKGNHKNQYDFQEKKIRKTLSKFLDHLSYDYDSMNLYKNLPLSRWFFHGDL